MNTDKTVYREKSDSILYRVFEKTKEVLRIKSVDPVIIDTTTPLDIKGDDGVKLQDESGVAYGVKHINNKPRVSSMPYTYDISEGNVAGHIPLFKFGSNPDVSTGEESIWQHGGLYPWALVDAAPGKVKLSSSSTDDVNVSGTGAWLVTIYGKNLVGVPQSEQLAMNGQNAVNSNLDYKRVDRIIVNTAGTGKKNAGVIYVGTGAVGTGVPAVVWATVAVGKNQTLQAIWSVPADKIFYLTSFLISTNSNKGNIINMYFRPPGELFQIKFPAYLFSTNVPYKFDFPLPLIAGTDIDCRAIGVATGAGIAVSFEGWYE